MSLHLIQPLIDVPGTVRKGTPNRKVSKLTNWRTATLQTPALRLSKVIAVSISWFLRCSCPRNLYRVSSKKKKTDERERKMMQKIKRDLEGLRQLVSRPFKPPGLARLKRTPSPYLVYHLEGYKSPCHFDTEGVSTFDHGARILSEGRRGGSGVLSTQNHLQNQGDTFLPLRMREEYTVTGQNARKIPCPTGHSDHPVHQT
ncbi:hypothetical protein TNCV_1307251 [Trichonephila clavipes]|nr:hypothetical protein TNCV_1307251 [Trichonephila clavipes]